jgi:nucleoside phosphorylase
VGWVCAIPIELAAAQEMLDEEHGPAQRYVNDENLYYLGSVAGHNVVIVCMPAGRIGNNPAAAVITQTKATFQGIKFGLMVGIGGGVPSAGADIRLGDVVVSQPNKAFGGVVQYDSGKAALTGFERAGSLNSPPQILLAAVASVRANGFRGRSKVSKYLVRLCQPLFQRDRAGADILFESSYNHEGGHTCGKCSMDRQEIRHPRKSEDEVVVHYGIIASGNQVIKNAVERDKLSADLGGVLCFEMEAAGLMNNFPCLVIRGICDYADSHKSKKWQPYAAATAAAYAKELLSVIPPTALAGSHMVDEANRWIRG